MKKESIRLIFVYSILALLLGAISYLRIFDTYELISLDLRFRARPLQKVDPQIVIVEIGNDTLTNLGQWPLPRDYHASLVKVLSDSGVKAIIFDVLFSEPKQGDRLLAEATKQAGCVYYPYALELDRVSSGSWQAKGIDTPLLPELEKAARGAGFANVLTDVDGKRRRIPLFISYQDRPLPQLTLKAAAGYLGLEPEDIKIFPGRSVQLGKSLPIPIDDQAAALVNLAGGWKDTFEHYSYYDILAAYAESGEGVRMPEFLTRLKGKICFVGLTATGTADLNATALEPVYPMIGLHANLFNSILTKSFLSRLPRTANLALLYLLCLAAVLITLNTKPLPGVLYQLGLVSLFIGAGFLVFIAAGIWIDLFFPVISSIVVYLGANIFRYINELQRRQLLEKELSIARKIQLSFLKQKPPKVSGAEIAVTMDTARHVGGDLYDFVQLPDGRVGLMVGDVSGKGVPAALFMAQVISQFRNFACRYSSSPAQTLTELNKEISRGSKSGLFVTMAYLIYNPATRQLNFASGGHLPPFLFRNGKLIEKLDVAEGIPLGLLAEADFAKKEVKLESGDLVLIYTDGITEARNKQGRDFEEEGIIRTLEEEPNLTSQVAIQHLQGAIGAFSRNLPQHDDITIMALNVS